MNTRMEEIMNAIEHNKLTADDPFRFHCTQCGKCCINREDILLTPLDLFRIANELKLSLKNSSASIASCISGRIRTFRSFG